MNLINTALVCAVMAASTPVFATTINLTSATSSGYSSSRSYLADGVSLNITAYTGGYVNSANQEQGNDITRSTIGAYGSNGLGIEVASTPEHSADNNNGNFDMFLLSFDRQVDLDALSIGWNQNDSDMSVLAYTGTGNATASFAGNKWDQALATDWTGRHHLDVADLPNDATAVNPTNIKSSTWLIGPQLWSLKNTPVTDLTPGAGATGADFVKLKTISFNVPTTSVPEIDGTQTGLALGLLISLMGMMRERRLKKSR